MKHKNSAASQKRVSPCNRSARSVVYLTDNVDTFYIELLSAKMSASGDYSFKAMISN